MDKMRLDIYCAKTTNISRLMASRIINDGFVTVNGVCEKQKSFDVSESDAILIELPEPEESAAIPEDIPLEVLYEDAGMAVINKPRGMPSHLGAGHFQGTLVNAVLFRFKDELSGINGVMRPGIVHRLDKDTSGAIAIAKSDFYHRKLADQLQTHEMRRIYLALCHGGFKEDEGTIAENIDRDKTDRLKRAVCPKTEGRRAVTHWRVLERFEKGAKKFTLVECSLETGRTHQIRVHMAHIGKPIVGDVIYGSPKLPFSDVGGQILHAAQVGFFHPITGEFMVISAETPEYFNEILSKIRKLTNV